MSIIPTDDMRAGVLPPHLPGVGDCVRELAQLPLGALPISRAETARANLSPVNKSSDEVWVAVHAVLNGYVVSSRHGLMIAKNARELTKVITSLRARDVLLPGKPGGG